MEVDPVQLGVLEASGRVVKDWMVFVVEGAGADEAMPWEHLVRGKWGEVNFVNGGNVWMCGGDCWKW